MQEIGRIKHDFSWREAKRKQKRQERMERGDDNFLPPRAFAVFLGKQGQNHFVNLWKEQLCLLSISIILSFPSSPLPGSLPLVFLFFPPSIQMTYYDDLISYNSASSSSSTSTSTTKTHYFLPPSLPASPLSLSLPSSFPSSRSLTPTTWSPPPLIFLDLQPKLTPPFLLPSLPPSLPPFLTSFALSAISLKSSTPLSIWSN